MVASAKASVDTARINLAYTKVYAPIAGRTGRSSVTEGALVEANQAAAMVVIQQLDPMYVDVTQASTLLLRLQRELADGKLKKTADAQAEARLVLEDGTPYSETGKLQFSEVTVDPGTDPSPCVPCSPIQETSCCPACSCASVSRKGVNEKGLLVPQRAVAHNSRGANPPPSWWAPTTKADLRVLKTDRAIGDQWLVSDGVADGDRSWSSACWLCSPGGEVHPHEATEAELRTGSFPAPSQQHP